jgi:hypothetical protein
VTLTLHGSRDRSLFGPETFYGTVDIAGGATMPYRANGTPLTLSFTPQFGGLISFDYQSNPYYVYGALYPNRSFTRFVVTEWQGHGRGASWSGATGLVIAAPARTRAQALRLSNKLMKAYLLPGHPLK